MLAFELRPNQWQAALGEFGGARCNHFTADRSSSSNTVEFCSRPSRTAFTGVELVHHMKISIIAGMRWALCAGLLLASNTQAADKQPDASGYLVEV